MNKKSDEVAALLKQLQQHGADVKIGTQKGDKISQQALNDLTSNASPSFDAWISWTKSF